MAQTIALNALPLPAKDAGVEEQLRGVVWQIFGQEGLRLIMLTGANDAKSGRWSSATVRHLDDVAAAVASRVRLLSRTVFIISRAHGRAAPGGACAECDPRRRRIADNIVQEKVAAAVAAAGGRVLVVDFEDGARYSVRPSGEAMLYISAPPADARDTGIVPVGANFDDPVQFSSLAAKCAIVTVPGGAVARMLAANEEPLECQGMKSLLGLDGVLMCGGMGRASLMCAGRDGDAPRTKRMPMDPVALRRIRPHRASALMAPAFGGYIDRVVGADADLLAGYKPACVGAAVWASMRAPLNGPDASKRIADATALALELVATM